MAKLSELIGRTVVKITTEDDEIIFFMENGERYKLYHEQDCCENVSIDDICGDLEDLIGSPITMSEEVSNYEPTSDEDKNRAKESNDWGSCTWTFYKFATIKGYVDVRWFGESNGYYSESVYFEKVA